MKLQLLLTFLISFVGAVLVTATPSPPARPARPAPAGDSRRRIPFGASTTGMAPPVAVRPVANEQNRVDEIIDSEDDDDFDDFDNNDVHHETAAVQAKDDSSTYDSCYYETSDPLILGAPRRQAALGNPLKGLLTSPRWTQYIDNRDEIDAALPASLEFYYIGWDEILKQENDYDWSALDQTLLDAKQRNNHVMWRVFCVYPGSPLRVPQYLIDAGIQLVTNQAGEPCPQFDDAIFLKAVRHFIAALGARYDGHTSLAFIQLGLLGYWGEWHTYPDSNLLSAETMDLVVGWYAAAFTVTRLQCRGSLTSVFATGKMGLHDDSFAYSTLGPTVDWFFWTRIESANQTDFWKHGVMGGETRPELQGAVFQPDYQPSSNPWDYRQDFFECVRTTHATYMFHHGAFMGTMSDEEMKIARRAHVRMGYNFRVTRIGVATVDDRSESGQEQVTLFVTVAHTGVAPFYYPLSLAVRCKLNSISGSNDQGNDGDHGDDDILAVQDNVETLLMQNGDSRDFAFVLPADACLSPTHRVQVTLESPWAHPGKPIRFAQGQNGTVAFELPAPKNSATRKPTPSNNNDDDEGTDDFFQGFATHA